MTVDEPDINIKNDEEVMTVKLPGDDFLEDPDLLKKIQKDLAKKHVGNEKELLLLFLSMLSSRLNPESRVSVKIRGDSSEGKTNLVKACLAYFPKNWYAFVTRGTRASFEDDIAPNYNLIVMLEKMNDLDSNEAIKQLSEDGLSLIHI